MWKKLNQFAANMEKEQKKEIDKALHEKEHAEFLAYLRKKGHDRIHSPDVFCRVADQCPASS